MGLTYSCIRHALDNAGTGGTNRHPRGRRHLRRCYRDGRQSNANQTRARHRQYVSVPSTSAGSNARSVDNTGGAALLADALRDGCEP